MLAIVIKLKLHMLSRRNVINELVTLQQQRTHLVRHILYTLLDRLLRLSFLMNQLFSVKISDGNMGVLLISVLV